MSTLTFIAAGALGGAVTAGIVYVLPAPWRLRVLAVFLGVAAGVYVGAALGAGATVTVLLMQAGGAIAYALLAVAGSNAPRALGAAWIAHALWDAFGYAGLFEPHLPEWYALACFGYDVAVGAALVLWPSAFRVLPR